MSTLILALHDLFLPPIRFGMKHLDPLTSKFLADIRAYADQIGVKPATVVSYSVGMGSPTFSNWETGNASPTFRTAAKVRAWIKANPIKR